MKLEKYKQNEYITVDLVDKDHGWIPGARVKHIIAQSAYGVVIAVVGEEITVLWSIPPLNFSTYAAMAAPLARRMNWQKLGRDIIKIEPMPAGAVPVYEVPKKSKKK